jgi:gluconolactonase
MYTMPPTIETRVFAKLPDSLRISNRATEWTRTHTVQHGAPTSFLEGPAFDRAGRLYCTDIPYGRIFRIDERGQFHVIAEYDGEPNGLKIHKDGRLFITDHKHGLMVLEPDSGKVEPFFIRPHSERFKGLNDLAFASNGDIYFTDQGESGLHDPTGRLFRLTVDGRLDLLLSNIPSPNGLTLDLAETTVYLNVTRMNAVWRVPLDPVRGVGKVGVFVYLSGGMGPDGATMDSEGNLVVAHTGRGTVWLFDVYGEPILRVLSPTRGGRTTNVAYGGPALKTLFITESNTGQILAADMPVPGRPLYSHQ